MGEVLAFELRKHTKKNFFSNKIGTKGTKFSWRFLSLIDLQISQVRNFPRLQPKGYGSSMGLRYLVIKPNKYDIVHQQGTWFCYFFLSQPPHTSWVHLSSVFKLSPFFFLRTFFQRLFFVSPPLSPSPVRDKILQWDHATYRESASSSQKSTLKFLSGVHLASSAPVALRKSSRLSTMGAGGGEERKIVQSINEPL